jgi:DNA (cytosine-5)-methyltransferase 1
MFEGMEKLRVIIRKDEIHLLPLATQKRANERLERIERKLAEGEPLEVASFCHGGGVLSLALHEGIKAAGIETELKLACDIDEDVLFHAAESNPMWNERTLAIAAPMQELVADPWAMKQIGTADLLEAGIPCVGASLSGRAKKGLSMAEADPNVGHLVVAFLALVNQLQPAIIVIENVPPYQNTASAHQIRSMLRDWGYEVSETILEAREFGAIEDRKRLVMVAVTKGLSFEVNSIEKPVLLNRPKLGDILEAIPPDDNAWSEMNYLREKEVRDIAAGKGFAMQIVGPEDDRVGTVGSGYSKNRSTEPKIRHPIEGDRLLRLLTAREHAAVKGVPVELIAGLSSTRAHEMLGNSICFEPFVAVGRSIGNALKQPRAQAEPEPFALQAA